MDKIEYTGLALVGFMLILALCAIGYSVNNAMTECTTESITEESTEPESEEWPIFHETVEPSDETTEPSAETVVETAAATEAETTREIRYYYGIPLSHDIQDYIFEKCEAYGLDPAIVVAIIHQESRFIPDIMGDNGASYGLMQINKKWHYGRMDELGVTNLLDPYQNIAVGVDYLAELYRYKGNIKWALMAYNGGYSYADRWYDKGKFSSYVEEILAYSESLTRDIPG